MKQLRLRFTDGPAKGKSYVLKGTLAVGRYRDNDIVLRTEHVSRHHARLVVSDGQIVVQDLGSKNGTFVNSQKISMLMLMPGDEITFGNVHGEVVEVEATVRDDMAGQTNDTRHSANIEHVWTPDPGFVGFSNLSEFSRHPSGVLLSGVSGVFGKAMLYCYLPKLSFEQVYRSKAQAHADKRAKISILGIPRILETGISEGILYVASQSAIGKPVSLLVNSGKHHSPSEAISLLASSVGILAELTPFNLIHGSITPDSLVLGTDGSVNLTMFGIMLKDSIKRDESEHAIQDIRDLCNTVLYAMTGSSLPERCTSSNMIIDSKLVPSPGGDMPESLFKVLVKGLSTEGKSRYSSIAEFRTDVYEMERGGHARVSDRISL